MKQVKTNKCSEQVANFNIFIQRLEKCECSIINETIEEIDLDNLFDKKELDKVFSTLSNTNFRVLKCYKLLLFFTKFIKNIGEI